VLTGNDTSFFNFIVPHYCYYHSAAVVDVVPVVVVGIIVAALLLDVNYDFGD